MCHAYINFSVCLCFRLTARSKDAAESAINFYLNEVEASKIVPHRLKPRALVVDGKTLTFILDLR